LNTASKPVVALVAGAALGGGCELVAFADIVIATPAARFGQPEIKLGAFPPVAAVVLPRVIGEKKAREMIYTGELVTAEAALSLQPRRRRKRA
jgi:cyclohexa-1,5-dienecarbonyl-CoA hydratase